MAPRKSNRRRKELPTRMMIWQDLMNRINGITSFAGNFTSRSSGVTNRSRRRSERVPCRDYCRAVCSGYRHLVLCAGLRSPHRPDAGQLQDGFPAHLGCPRLLPYS